MDTAEYDNLKDDAEIVEEAFTIEDTKNEKDEWDYRTVQFKVKNNTGYTFPEYAIIYRVDITPLIDGYKQLTGDNIADEGLTNILLTHGE